MVKINWIFVAFVFTWKEAVSFQFKSLFQRRGLGLGVSRICKAIARDEQGYEIKPKDWFNGLSLDPGASLTDPRAVPPECRTFAEKVKLKELSPSFKETIELIDKHYNYFEVPFSCGDQYNKPNENTGAAKILSFGLMTKMNEAQTLSLFGEIYRDMSPSGSDHPNLRNFAKYGWAKVSFNTGLAIISKLQAYDDTDSALATQALLEGKNEWDPDADSWIP
mmetsp:Transcript_30269/g.41641  ORF Transcript_30269/g.41641 Transcript_30269/m.41641 type:complete len:221 (+) Transcript_30269:3-665(+)